MAPFAKREIKRSFLRLLSEEPISQITVKEIVEDCGVNRNSFYYHFQDIPSLLEEIVVEIADDVIRSLPQDAAMEDCVRMALGELARNKKVLYNIYCSSNSRFYEKQIMRICEHVTRAYINSRAYARNINEKDLHYIISFLKSVMFGEIIDWLIQDMSYDLTEHSVNLCRMFAGTLTAACRKCSPNSPDNDKDQLH